MVLVGGVLVVHSDRWRCWWLMVLVEGWWLVVLVEGWWLMVVVRGGGVRG